MSGGGYRLDRGMAGVDWAAVKAALAADRFDNGRTPEQLARSFRASAHTVLARVGEGTVIGTARLLADGVCNAYLVDVWTHAPWRGRGVASAMVRDLLDRVPGHHVGLFTEHAAGLYQRLGFAVEREGMSVVVGRWLDTGGR